MKAEKVRIWGTRAYAYADIEAAKADYLEEHAEPAHDDEVGLNIYEDDEGNRWYRVGNADDGTNCWWESVDSVDEWWNEEWTEHRDEVVWNVTEEGYTL